MKKNEINLSTARRVKKTFKKFSEDEILVIASKIELNYMEKNKEKIEKENKLKQEQFEKAIDKEFLYLKLFGPD